MVILVTGDGHRWFAAAAEAQSAHSSAINKEIRIMFLFVRCVLGSVENG